MKVGTTAALLQMLEDDVVFRDLSLENPIRAIREISHDITCRRRVRLANGRELSALDIQWEYLERAMRYGRTVGFPAQVEHALEMWEYLLTGLEKDPLSLHRECDWVAKHRLIERYVEERSIPLSASPAGAGRPQLPRRQTRPRALLPPGAARSGRAGGHRRGGDQGGDRAARHHQGQIAGRLHQGGQEPQRATSPSTGCTSSSTTRHSAPCCARTRSVPSTSGSTS